MAETIDVMGRVKKVGQAARDVARQLGKPSSRRATMRIAEDCRRVSYRLRLGLSVKIFAVEEDGSSDPEEEPNDIQVPEALPT
jgi:hypothetical protein